MATFSASGSTRTADGKKGARATKRTAQWPRMVPPQFGVGAAVFMHPFAASAAASALSAGMASAMFRFWMDTFAQSLETTEKMTCVALGLRLDDDKPAYCGPQSQAKRVKAAVETVVADVEENTRAAIEVSGKTAMEIEHDIAAAVAKAIPRSEPAAATESARASAKAAAKPAPRTQGVSSSRSAAKGEKTPAERGSADAKAARSALPKSSGKERPVEVDDLKLISGIGPKLEQVLNELGVWTYRQISAWSEAEIASVEEHLGFKGRVGRDEWLRQATELAKKRA